MGAITYDFLNPRFVIPRPYLSKIAIRGDFNVLPFWDGNVIQFTSTAGYIYRLAFKPEVYAWSTAAYTLDHLMDETASSIDCVLFPCHDIVDLIFGVYINDERPLLSFHPLALGTTVYPLSLPPAPPDYWLPNP